MLLIMVSLVNITSGYLAAIQGYRQEQTSDLMLWVALPQLITLPIVAIICNTPRVDCRWVLAISLLLMATACVLAAQLTPEWNGDTFRVIALLQAIAQPMAIIPLLMQATGGLLPTDGPFAAAWFNAVKGFAATAAAAHRAAQPAARGLSRRHDRRRLWLGVQPRIGVGGAVGAACRPAGPRAGQRRSLSVGCRPGVITDRADFIYADPYLSAAFGRRLTFYHQK
ncbi:hypothetical protein M8494_33045 [Serratia ureilytica]